MKSLAEHLGVMPTDGEASPTNGEASPAEAAPQTETRLEDITDSKTFALAVLNSSEFRRYIVSGLVLGNLPGFAGILMRMMDYAWGKPVDRVEHTGKDGNPIIEVRRVVVRADSTIEDFEERESTVTKH